MDSVFTTFDGNLRRRLSEPQSFFGGDPPYEIMGLTTIARPPGAFRGHGRRCVMGRGASHDGRGKSAFLGFDGGSRRRLSEPRSFFGGDHPMKSWG